ncbi:MAG TPA: hypothetical protein VEJ36_08595 [Nitrososphaerales archaeon]|nr:hypothetical protein [Nitrososphaerales archaeon]
MVDSTTVIIVATLTQTVVITLTLAVFIFQFRSQEKAIREAAVQSVMGRYTDYVRMLVEKPELANKLLTQPDIARDVQIDDEDQVVAAYLLLGYGLFEEVYGLYKKGWMDEETWQQWSAFLERMARQPLFQSVHRFSSGTYDKEFQDYVTRIIERNSNKPSQPSSN